MKTNTEHMLTVMRVVVWILFIGFCIQAGTVLISSSVSLFVNPAAAKDLDSSLDLSVLHRISIRYYVYMVSFVIFLAGTKAYIFYLVIRLLSKLNLNHPFSPAVSSLIDSISQVTLSTGILALIANSYADWLGKRGMPAPQHWGSAELLFMAGVIFVIALIFRRGTELQAENDLTI